MKLIALTINGKYSINPPADAPNVSGNSGIIKILTVLFPTLFLIGILLCLIYLLWGGIDFITSGHEKTKFQAAKNKILYAIVGLIIMFISFFIIRIIGAIFGVGLI
jgi:hypothetical protein